MAGSKGGGRFPTRCLHAALDAEAYSGRTSPRQRDLQRRISDVLYYAAESVGFAPGELWVQPQGDGGLLRFPVEIDEAATVAGLIRELRIELAAINRDLVPEAQVRMRLALHVGLSQDAELGLAGEAPVLVSRLLNSPELRALLRRAADTPLVSIMSDALFRDLVVNRLRGLDPEEWESVQVVDSAKKFECAAWMTAVGGNVPVSSADHSGGAGAAAAATGLPVDERAGQARGARAEDGPQHQVRGVRPGEAGSQPLVGDVESIGKFSVFNGPVNIEHGGFTIN
jgi:hypothetical protein